MPEVLTRADEGARRPTMRQLYEAARHDHISRAHERTFEEWCRKVSDYGLDDAEQAYIQIRDCENARLQMAVVEAAKARRGAERVFDANPSTAPALMSAEVAEDAAVDALIAFEVEHKIGEDDA